MQHSAAIRSKPFSFIHSLIAVVGVARLRAVAD